MALVYVVMIAMGVFGLVARRVVSGAVTPRQAAAPVLSIVAGVALLVVLFVLR